jgi:hypothetical protein
MVDLNPAKRELEWAKNCLKRMQDSNTLEEIEEAWSNYLSCIEKVFTRLDLAIYSHKKYNGFISPYNCQRKKDDLLSYLKHARNSDHHGLSATTQKSSSGVGFGSVDESGSFSMVLSSDMNGNFSMIPISPVKVTFYPERVEVLPCKDRNQNIHHPPVSHLHNPIGSRSPIILAGMGISYYEEMLNSAEKFFS